MKLVKHGEIFLTYKTSNCDLNHYEEKLPKSIRYVVFNLTHKTYTVETFKMEGDSESASAVADKKVKYEGGGMAAASFYGPAAAAAAGAVTVKEERREPDFARPDVSVIEDDDDDGVENGGERAKGKGEMI